MQNTSHAVMAQRTEPKDSADDFPTLPWATRGLIVHISENKKSLVNMNCLEPACGAGHMAKVWREHVGFLPCWRLISLAAQYAPEASKPQQPARAPHPDVIVFKVEGPVFFAELGQPDSFIGSWSHAEATVTGPQPTPDGLSIELANFKLDRVANNGAKPLASAEQVAFRARLDPIATAATKKAAYDLTSDITAGSLPMGPPMAARPFEARVKAVLHGVGDMTSKPLPAQIKGVAVQWRPR